MNGSVRMEEQGLGVITIRYVHTYVNISWRDGAESEMARCYSGRASDNMLITHL